MGDSHYCLFGFLAAGATLLVGLTWLPELSGQLNIHTGIPEAVSRILMGAVLFTLTGLIAAYGPHWLDPSCRRDPYWTSDLDDDATGAA